MAIVDAALKPGRESAEWLVLTSVVLRRTETRVSVSVEKREYWSSSPESRAEAVGRECADLLYRLLFITVMKWLANEN